MADVAETALAYIAFAEKVAEEPGFYVPPHLRDPVQIMRELLAENERLWERLNNPDAVHVNMLRGSISRPSVEQIIHIYGADIIRAALAGEKDKK